jgi:hypothetical protein
MGVVVLDDIDDDDCDGAMDSDYEDDNGDGAMDNNDDDDNNDDVDGDGAIDDNYDNNDSDDNVVVQTPAHRRRRRHWQRILSRAAGGRVIK